LTDLTNFFNRLTGSGKIIFITANPTEWSDEIHNTFRMITTIHFRTSRESAPGIGIVYNMYLEKFNGARYKYDPVTRFSVRPGVGLTIESSGVAF
jgi:archaellum biogenesis ATPase FlaH